VRVCCTASTWKVAVQVFSEFIVTVMVALLPMQSPDQPANTAPWPGMAVKFTCVPCGNWAAQVPGQSMPSGLLLTLPEPDMTTLRV
jgi:hypothetical protein